MKSVKALREIVLFVIGLGIVGLATAAIISTLRKPAPGSLAVAASPSPTLSPQQSATPPQELTTAVPYPFPAPAYSITPDIGATQTAVQYIIQFSTEHPATLGPTVYETPNPTGTVESDVYLSASGRKLGVVT
jgi:hypothetical protein